MLRIVGKDPDARLQITSGKRSRGKRGTYLWPRMGMPEVPDAAATGPLITGKLMIILDAASDTIVYAAPGALKS